MVANAQLLAGLGAGWDLHGDRFAGDGGDLDLVAGDCLAERDACLHQQVVAVAREDLVHWARVEALAPEEINFAVSLGGPLSPWRRSSVGRECFACGAASWRAWPPPPRAATPRSPAAAME